MYVSTHSGFHFFDFSGHHIFHISYRDRSKKSNKIGLLICDGKQEHMQNVTEVFDTTTFLNAAPNDRNFRELKTDPLMLSANVVSVDCKRERQASIFLEVASLTALFSACSLLWRDVRDDNCHKQQ